MTTYAHPPEMTMDSHDVRSATTADIIEKVRERGHSLLAAEPELLERHRVALTEFEESDRLPRHGRAVQQATAELAELFCPDLTPGERYDVASIVVLVPAVPDRPPIALRMTGLPPDASTVEIEDWVEALKQVAAAAGDTSTD